MGVRIERVGCLDDAGDEHDQRDHNSGIDRLEEQAHRRMPAAMWVGCPYDPLGEDEIDDEEQHDARGDENLGCERDPHVEGSRGPNDAHYAADGAGHAETEHHSGHEELVPSPLIELEDDHMGNGTEDEEEEEDGGDGNVRVKGGHTAQAGGGGSIWGMSAVVGWSCGLSLRVSVACARRSGVRNTGALGARRCIVQTDINGGIWICVRVCGSGMKNEWENYGGGEDKEKPCAMGLYPS